MMYLMLSKWVKLFATVFKKMKVIGHFCSECKSIL